MNELGLKEINNCAFLMSTADVIKKLLLVADYIAYGQPDKKLVEEVLRTRGFLKTAEHKRVPMQDNILIEELLGSQGVICLEDLVDAFYSCKRDQVVYEACRNALWPIQLAAKKDLIKDKSITHEASGREFRKQISKFSKGGYLGMQGAKINEYVRSLI